MENNQNEAVKARAYQLWVESGYAHGHDKEHWRQAERELDGVVQTDNITKGGHHLRDSASKVLEQDDDPTIIHHVPEPGPGR